MTQKVQNKNSFKRKSKKPTKKVKKSSINPEDLIQKASINTAKPIEVDNRFSEMNLNPVLKANIAKIGFVKPTPIQDQSLDKLIDGENLIGIANTGTGKTGAFLIPIIENLLDDEKDKFQSLIILPTRELALQVYDEFKKLGLNLKLTAGCFIGGTNIEKDIRSLKNRFDVIIGTPGRLIDLKNRKALKLTAVEVLVLDEFDKMLDMGFIKDIRTIVNELKNRKQTILFSATNNRSQKSIIDELVKNPFLVEINKGNETSKNVEQDIIRLGDGQDKFKVLIDLLKDERFDKVILFMEMKHQANRLSKKLNKHGVKADQIHGDKSQNYRVNALNKFKTGAIQVLVATDVAARGIDVNDVSLVINYELPKEYDSYIHRIGRTGRAGKTGHAITFID